MKKAIFLDLDSLLSISSFAITISISEGDATTSYQCNGTVENCLSDLIRMERDDRPSEQKDQEDQTQEDQTHECVKISNQDQCMD